MEYGIYARRGDLMFTRGHTGLGAAIRWAERLPGEEPTWANHTGVVVEPGWILPPSVFDDHTLIANPAVVVESLWKTIEHPWYPDQGPDNEVSIWRYDGLTDLQASIIARRARRFVGRKYGWWKLITHLVDNRVFGGEVKTRKFLHVDNRPICSYTAATSFSVAGVRTGNIPARAQSPDSMWDYVGANAPWFEVGRGRVREEVS